MPIEAFDDTLAHARVSAVERDPRRLYTMNCNGRNPRVSKGVGDSSDTMLETRVAASYLGVTMKRLHIILGFTAVAIFVLSGLAHSLLGWPILNAELTHAQVPSDLIRVLAIGWHFGGVAMITFGCIVLFLFAKATKDKAISLRPALFIALAYVAFGSLALVFSNFNPFFLLFVIPGCLLLVASLRSGRQPEHNGQTHRANQDYAADRE